MGPGTEAGTQELSHAISSGGVSQASTPSNRIAVYEDLRFAYDVHGNITERRIGWHTVQHLHYSAEHQLKSITVTRLHDKPTLKAVGQQETTPPAATTQTTHYRYDALGRRIDKTGSFGTTRFGWDGDLLALEIRGSKQSEYLYEPDSFVPLAKLESATHIQRPEHKAIHPKKVASLFKTAQTDSEQKEAPAHASQAQEAIESEASVEAVKEKVKDFSVYYYHCDQIGAPQELTDEQGHIVWAVDYKVWGRMVPGQIGLHLSELREQAEKLRLPEAASPSLAIRVLHYHCDHLGTPRELTDESGKLAWSAEYMAWGKLKRLQGRAGGSADAGNGGIPPDQFWHTSTQPGRANHLPEWVADNTGNVRRWREAQEVEQSEISQAANDPTVWGELTDQSIRFQGQWHDQETGLHYNRFRYYDPDIGRFIHQDTIGLDGGFNLYMYAHSPSNGVDPFGLCSTKLNKGLAGVAYDGKQAHHIIPEEIWKRNAGFFDKIGMGNMMDHRSNGVLMPSSAKKAKEMRRRYYHCGSHDNYSSQTEHGVKDIKDRFEKGKISAADARMEIARLQEARRITLTAPLMPGQSPVRIY